MRPSSTGTLYAPLDAMRLIKDQELSKFDATVEVHFRLGVNVRHADQQLRGTIALPHGTGREVTVAVFAEGDKAREAEAAGADVVGGADLAKRVSGGLHRVRRRDRHAGHDGRGRQARPGARTRGQDAEPQDRHGHLRHREGRRAT